jgi:hypothetical protein
MSSTAETTEADVCANCGAAEVDDIKLEICDGCDLVKYCSDNCREEHREKHEEECKNRKALLHDRKLFTQPDETHLGECPLCFLPLPLDKRKYGFYSCCSETICRGCVYANLMANIHDEMKARSCPFCREVAKTDEDRKRLMKRIKANDPAALRHVGLERYEERDYDGAFEYLTKAAELGDLMAHCQLGFMYALGRCVEKDEEKEVYHYEKAAIGGHPTARYNLACFEARNGRMERSVKHFIIGAKLGDEDSMRGVWSGFKDGNITKEDLDATLRAHQAAIDEMKSAQRDAAEASGIFQ